MRFVRGLSSLAALLALVVGAPVLLVRFGRLDVATTLGWRDLLVVGDTGVLLLLAMTAAAWLAWAVVLASVLAEVAAVLSRGRVRLRVPGGGWVQPVVASLVVATAAMVVAPGASAMAQTRPGPPAAPTVVTAPAVLPEPAHAPEPPPASADAGDADTTAPHHVVEPGDDLWTIAERHYGDGTRWRTIAQANHLSPSDVLPVGLDLVLPGAAPPPAPAGEGGGHAGDVVVQPGDTLTELAEEHLGDPQRWPEIARANRDVVHDPDLLEPGWHLRLPAATQSRAEDGPHRTGHAKPTADSTRSGADGVRSSTGAVRSSDDGTRSSGDEPPSSTDAGRLPDDATGSSIQRTQPAPGDGAAPSPVHGTGGEQPRRTPAEQPRRTPAEQPRRTPAEQPPRSTPERTPAPERTTGPLPTEGVAEDVAAGRADHVTDEQDPGLAEVAGVGLLLSAALSGALAARRRTQLARRGLGRRIILPSPEALHVESALDRAASRAPAPPDHAGLTDALLGAVDEQPVLLDLEAATTTLVHGDPELVDSLVAALGTGLALQPWSAESGLVLVGGLPWMRALDEPQVQVLDDPEQALVGLERAVAARRIALGRLAMAGGGAATVPGIDQLRQDPDLWEAWAPQVYVFAHRLDAPGWQRVRRSLDGSPVGISVLAASDEVRDCGEMVEVGAAGARICSTGLEFTPSLVDATARRALVELAETSTSDATTPAPWWSHDDDLPPNLALLSERRPTLHHDEETPVEANTVIHPTLLLLGPVELHGCRGSEPNRARRQCIEYCAWLHENPGATATRMSRELLVAEGTRRSNMSRLRTWLGTDAQGELYLPDAYSGRIQLHPAVSSDWEHLQLLVRPGVNRTSTETLVEALELVRGAPLADAAPGQWHWAEEMRTDMVSVVRDVGVVLVRRALQDADLDLARWAACRALAAAPADELLMCGRIRTEHHAGNRPEVERLVMQVTRHARNIGVDLAEETVSLLQEVMEGRRRALRA